ncbi:hypothetical protein HOY80DRAFT_1042196 [Tuber brumale]|nr:hypothetical protein HOY80DRAFT_1042196 [Tuber brumale]
MIYLIHKDYKAKIDKLLDIVDAYKFKLNELKATSCPNIPTLMPSPSIWQGAREPSTESTTSLLLATSFLFTATPTWATVTKKGRKKSSVPSKAMRPKSLIGESVEEGSSR